MSHLNSCFDPDVDTFFDFDHTSFASTSSSPDTKSKAPISHRPSFMSPNHGFVSRESQQTFSGPSFQYDSYKQQTGLPMGGLANTFAVNQATGMQYTPGNQGFVMPTEVLNVPLTTDFGDFDFSHNPSVDMSDIDFDAESSPHSLPTMFYPSTSSSNGQSINPNALVSQEQSPTYSAPVQRIYPGMHSEQAAQAKALQEQKQKEAARLQQQRQLQGQRPLPAQSKSHQDKDPHVEESISRLLSQMRQSSVVSAEENASTPTDNMSNAARFKKDEEDMDEDERLLASEEGKKLSSKERRQLRNKVSARAFRSRRKEYISQLEGEVAVKVQEANDLKVQNRQLMEENTRLTDLTRMLLSSQAFSGFLDELSAKGTPAPATTAEAPASQSRPHPTRKDVNPHQAARQLQNQSSQVGMALVPEPTVDFPMLEVNPMNTWNSGNRFQVFAVTELPQGPAVDTDILAGKKSNFVEPRSSSGNASKDLPIVENIPSFVTAKEALRSCTAPVDDDVELDPTAFALFFDSPQPSTAVTEDKPLDMFGRVPLAKVFNRIDLLVEDGDAEAVAWARLEKMCRSLDIVCERISAFTSHIS